MKWSKFKEIYDASPWLHMHIGPCGLVSLPLNVPVAQALRELKKFVRENLEYIAFRPFENLPDSFHSLTDTDWSTHTSPADFPSITFHVGMSQSLTIHYHIVGRDTEFYERANHLNGKSIEEVLRDLSEWNTSYWLPKGCKLQLGGIVKRTIYFDQLEKTRREQINVYPFPVDFLSTLSS